MVKPSCAPHPTPPPSHRLIALNFHCLGDPSTHPLFLHLLWSAPRMNMYQGTVGVGGGKSPPTIKSPLLQKIFQKADSHTCNYKKKNSNLLLNSSEPCIHPTSVSSKPMVHPAWSLTLEAMSSWSCGLSHWSRHARHFRQLKRCKQSFEFKHTGMKNCFSSFLQGKSDTTGPIQPKLNLASAG